MKAQFQKLQLALFARSLQPADWQFDPHNTEDIRGLQVELMHRHLNRTISATDFSLNNQAVGNLIKIITPTTTTLPQDKEQIITAFMHELSATCQNMIIGEIRKKSLEAISA